MSNHIDLYDAKKNLGRHALPDRINTDANNYFHLGIVRKGGGNGIVFDALHYEKLSLKKTCALKFLRRLDEARVDRFKNEVRIVKQLQHANIAQFYAEGSVTVEKYEVPWIAQELGGRNLREHVDNHGAISAANIVSISLQMCDAIKHLHSKGFIHRDIKPNNFVWVENSKTDVMMIDLGIAKRLTEDVSGRPMDTLTRTLDFVGPLFFSSPELIAYAKDKNVVVDTRSDIFQLGKTLWFLATGKISAGVPSKALCPMNGHFRNLVLAAVDDDAASRPQSIEEFRKEIEAL